MEKNMIKISYATFLSAVCMIFLTWSFTKLSDNTCIFQPFENYEEIIIEDIKKKHSK